MTVRMLVVTQAGRKLDASLVNTANDWSGLSAINECFGEPE